MGHTRTHTRQGDKRQRALGTGGAGGLPPSLSAAPREGPGGLPAPALHTRGRRGAGPQDDLSAPASFGQGTEFHLLCSLTWPQSGGRPEQGSQPEPAPQDPSPTSRTAMGGAGQVFCVLLCQSGPAVLSWESAHFHPVGDSVVQGLPGRGSGGPATPRCRPPADRKAPADPQHTPRSIPP